MNFLICILAIALAPHLIHGQFIDKLPSLAEIKAACKNDHTDMRANCAEEAFAGKCVGGSVRERVFRQSICPCSCNQVFIHRIQTCCSVVGGQAYSGDYKDCLQLCRYNVTYDDINSDLALKCTKHMATWVYCAWDEVDGRECCKKNGVSDQCAELFCQGTLPCDIEQLLKMSGCTAELDGVSNKCMFENMNPLKPQWKPEWKSKCDWSQFEPTQPLLSSGTSKSKGK